MMTQTVPEPGQMAPTSAERSRWRVLLRLRAQGPEPGCAGVLPLAFSAVCSHQLPDLEKFMPQFEKAGAVVYGISVDSHHANTAFAKSLNLSFPLLSDWKHEASAAYGVLLPDAGYSGRATFVIGKDGRLLWREISENMSDLEKVPSPERALAAITRG